MKTHLLSIFLLSIVGFSTGQVVYSDPPFASEEDSIIIYFDATEGNKGLEGYTGDDVYAHTGVLTNYSQNSGDWKHVIAGWSENIPKAQLIRVDTDLYKLVIEYPREYYEMDDPNEYIIKLAFVFRNSDASASGRDIGDANIFLPLTQGFHVNILSPQIDFSFGHPRRSPVFLNKSDSVKIEISWTMVETQITSLELYTNGLLLAETINDTLYYTFKSSENDTSFIEFNAIVTDTAGLVDSSKFEILIKTSVTESILPGELQAGINYIDDNTVTLALFAPYKEFVYVIGDFNNWMVDPAYQMNKYTASEDSVYWWLTIGDLTPGTEYGFQYFIDGEIRVADPYTHKILDLWNDQYIEETTYPGLKPYPYGKTDYACSILETDQMPYDWQVENFIAPDQTELIIYELLVRDFIEGHNYLTLIDTLDYLQNLGINAIELMPVNEFDGNISWGYNPAFYFAPDKYYGPQNTLKQFIDVCHQRGIAVIIDMVLNHSYGQSPFVRLYNEGDYGKPTTENPWYNVESPNPVYSWGMDFNHESPETKKLVDRVNKYWLTEFKVDGFRFDFTKGFTNTPGDGGAYDDSRIAILKRMADKIWEVKQNAYIILEHFAYNDEELALARHGMLVWGNSNSNYNEASMGYHKDECGNYGKSDFSWGFYKERYWDVPHLVTYMESHDEERLMAKNLAHGNSSGNYNIKNLPTALQRIKMNAVFFFTLPGPKMIWQFEELGYDFNINYPGEMGGDKYRTDQKPIHWDYFSDIDRNRLYRTFAALINLRREHSLFTGASTTVEQYVEREVKRIHLSNDLMKAVVIGNFDVINRNGQPLFLIEGWWYDFFLGDSFYVSNTDTIISLLPGEFHIFTDKHIAKPDEDLLTSLNTRSIDQPDEFKLYQNYPNPFNPKTNIRYTVGANHDSPVEIDLSIYNILGQKISTLVKKKQQPGTYSIEWDASRTGEIASGIYYYCLKTDFNYQTKKMIFIK